jgi:hypothetical protein
VHTTPSDQITSSANTCTAFRVQPLYLAKSIAFLKRETRLQFAHLKEKLGLPVKVGVNIIEFFVNNLIFIPNTFNKETICRNTGKAFFL